MKLLLVIVITLMASSCSTSGWNKAAAKKSCMASMKADASGTIMAGVDKICDCIADKMIMKYKSEKEAEKDPSGATEIGIQCAQESIK